MGQAAAHNASIPRGAGLSHSVPLWVQPGKQKMMAHVLRTLPLQWETWLGFQAPSFTLVQPWLLQVLGGENHEIEARNSLVHFCTLSALKGNGLGRTRVIVHSTPNPSPSLPTPPYFRGQEFSSWIQTMGDWLIPEPPQPLGSSDPPPT